MCTRDLALASRSRSSDRTILFTLPLFQPLASAMKAMKVGAEPSSTGQLAEALADAREAGEQGEQAGGEQKIVVVKALPASMAIVD